MKIVIITVSDRASRGEYEDLSGPEIEKIIQDGGIQAEIVRKIVPDTEHLINSAILQNQDADYIITTGGTGLSPRDITPEITEKLCEKSLPGIAEVLRAESCRETPNALLSRGYAGILGRTIIVNFPGSVKAVRLCTRVILPVLEHGVAMMEGKSH